VVEDVEGLFVEGTIEDAYERAQDAWEGIARSRIEEVSPPDWNDVIDFFVSLDEESDRAIPVLAFAFIDGEIERLLREAVNQKVHGGVSQLFGPLGPMGAASTRINMAHALYWLRDDTVHDLHLLRRIRNRFAHQRIDDGLRDSETISDLSDHRLLPRIVNALYPDAHNLLTEAESDLDLRVFMTMRTHIVGASALTAWSALGELYVAPTSVRTGIDPLALMDAHSPSAPQGIKDQHDLFRRLMDTFIVGPLESQAAKLVELANRSLGEEE
jgi:DNA-binding MltR family transcriptional regulator